MLPLIVYKKQPSHQIYFNHNCDFIFSPRRYYDKNSCWFCSLIHIYSAWRVRVLIIHTEWPTIHVQFISRNIYVLLRALSYWDYITVSCWRMYYIYPHSSALLQWYDDIKWKHFPRYRPLVRGIHRWPVNSPHKGPVTRMFDVFIDLRLYKRLSKSREAGDLRRHRAHYDVIVMKPWVSVKVKPMIWIKPTRGPFINMD